MPQSILVCAQWQTRACGAFTRACERSGKRTVLCSPAKNASMVRRRKSKLNRQKKIKKSRQQIGIQTFLRTCPVLFRGDLPNLKTTGNFLSSAERLFGSKSKNVNGIESIK